MKGQRGMNAFPTKDRPSVQVGIVTIKEGGKIIPREEFARLPGNDKEPIDPMAEWALKSFVCESVFRQREDQARRFGFPRRRSGITVGE